MPTRLSKPRTLIALLLFALALPLFAPGSDSGKTRTVKLKVALDEEFRHRSPRHLEVRKWVTTASYFFEKHFGLAFEIDEIKPWSSDNSHRSLSGLFQDLYAKIDRGKSDIVLGITAQFRSEIEVSGVASYLHGCALVKKMRYEYLTGLTIVHELGHLFVAVDLAEKSSFMNKDEPRLECDEFTKRVVNLNRNRRFDSPAFPLSAEDMNSLLPLYIERKSLGRGEAGVPLMLAIFYLEMKEPEKAIQECLEAEKIAPHDPAIQTLLKLAAEQKQRSE